MSITSTLKRTLRFAVLGVVLMFPAFTPVSADQILDGFSFKAQRDNVSQNIAHALMAKNAAIVIDVRSPAEYENGHIAGAYNIPLEGLSSNPDVALLRKAGVPVLVYCRSGRRSGNAVDILHAMDIKVALNFGGILTWEYGLTKEDPHVSLRQALEQIKTYPELNQ